MLETLNELYRVHGLLINYFYPSQKLLEKTRVGSKVKKRYDAPQSPAVRLLAHPGVPEQVKEKTRAIRASLNPIQLAYEVERLSNKLRRLLQADCPALAKTQSTP